MMGDLYSTKQKPIPAVVESADDGLMYEVSKISEGRQTK
jgi:hypothetical protein